jgi:hypothetical protein
MSFELAVVWGIGACTVAYALTLILPRMARRAILEVYREWRKLRQELQSAQREFSDPGTDFMRIDPRDTRPVPELMKQ